MITAWLGSDEIKSRTIAMMEQHRELDRLAQGAYWEDGKGCHLGCLTHADHGAHEMAAILFGLPLRVCYWLEAIFEGLPREDAEWWAVESLRAIPVGADLSLAHHVFAAWLLGPESPSAAGNADPLVAEAVAVVRQLHERAAKGDSVNTGEWSAALSAAWSAESAAWSAESAAQSAESAARSAARSAESAALSAAWSAWSAAWSAWSAESAAWSAARSAAWKSIAEKTLAIFQGCPVAACDANDAQREATLIHLRAIDLVAA